MAVSGLNAINSKVPSIDMTSMNKAWDLITKQESNLNAYFDQAGQDFNTQYNSMYGREMQDAINAMAGTGVFESPVSENALNRKRAVLGETYAVGKSRLAGERMTAQSNIEQQKINYYSKLNDIQYQEAMNKYAAKNEMYGIIGSFGATVAGL